MHVVCNCMSRSPTSRRVLEEEYELNDTLYKELAESEFQLYPTGMST